MHIGCDYFEVVILTGLQKVCWSLLALAHVSLSSEGSTSTFARCVSDRHSLDALVCAGCCSQSGRKHSSCQLPYSSPFRVGDFRANSQGSLLTYDSILTHVPLCATRYAPPLLMLP